MSMVFRELVIIGTGGMGRETLWIAREMNKAEGGVRFESICFATCIEEQHGSDICGAPVMGPEDWVVGREGAAAVCAIGNPRSRRQVVKRLEAAGVEFTTVVHPSVQMSEFVTLGRGCILSCGSIITTQAELGDHVILNLNATVSHDCSLEDFATLAPGVSVSGHVKIGSGADLGTNCTIIPRVTVGQGAVIGAGAVVIRDVPRNSVAVGTPARVIRTLDKTDRI